MKRLDIPLQAVFDTLQAYLGSAYVNDFNKFGRTFKVYLQADSMYRATPKDILNLRVRSNKGEMIPLGTLLEVQRTFGPPTLTRYNVYPAASIKGSPATGFQLRSGDRCHGEHGGSGPAIHDGLRVDRHRAPGEAVRWEVGSDLRPRHRPRLSRARGAVRVLVDPVVGHPRHPDRRARRLGLHDRARIHEQRLYPGRSRPAHRTGLQELDPDRRVRQGRARARARASWTPRCRRRACGSGPS